MIAGEDNKIGSRRSSSSRVRLALFLRDFFLADCGAALAQALAEMPGSPRFRDADEIEYEFNRLFVGPAAPKAPPYASVYLEKEPRLMGETTRRIAKFYEAMGLTPSQEGLPPDFLGLELEAWLYIERRLAESEDADLREAARFLWTHIKSWLPLFLLRLRSCPLSPALAAVAALLDEWLEAEKG